MWLDSLTKAEFNTAYIAHIIADKPNGPRGDPVLSEELKTDIDNLMLMCDPHHRLIDREDVSGHSVERLRGMKVLHEERIDMVTHLAPGKQSHVLLYGANIGAQGSPLSFDQAARDMVPDRYPATHQPLNLSLINSSLEDRSPDFWNFEAAHLKQIVAHQVRPPISRGEVAHLSVFALAPQPLLMLLGAELSDIPFAEVYQRRKEPQSWRWEAEPTAFEFQVEAPSTCLGDPALVFALSATISDSRVTSVLGEDTSIWRVTIPEPHNDFLRSRAQAAEFRRTMRSLLDRIKAAHGENVTLHVFPAMPVALAVDFGRVLNRKADLPLTVYDENKSLGGFATALEIGPR